MVKHGGNAKVENRLWRKPGENSNTHLWWDMGAVISLCMIVRIVDVTPLILTWLSCFDMAQCLRYSGNLTVRHGGTCHNQLPM